MKKSITLITLIATAALLAGCGKSSQQASSNTGSDSTPSSTDTGSTDTGSEDTGSTDTNPGTDTDTTDTDTTPEPAFNGIITLDGSGEEVILEAVDGVYTITNTVDDQEYHVYGEINDAIVFSAESTLSAKLMLHNATITNSTVSPVQWLASKKKVKVNAYEGESKIICKADGVAAISSESNCDIQGEARLGISSDGTCVSATDVAVEGSAQFALVSKSKNGISCKSLVLGEESGATSEAIAENTFTLAVMAAKAGIKAELNKSSKKGTIDANYAGEVSISRCATGISSEGAATLNYGTLKLQGNTISHSFATSTIADTFTLEVTE